MSSFILKEILKDFRNLNQFLKNDLITNNWIYQMEKQRKIPWYTKDAYL